MSSTSCSPSLSASLVPINYFENKGYNFSKHLSRLSLIHVI